MVELHARTNTLKEVLLSRVYKAVSMPGGDGCLPDNELPACCGRPCGADAVGTGPLFSGLHPAARGGGLPQRRTRRSEAGDHTGVHSEIQCGHPRAAFQLNGTGEPFLAGIGTCVLQFFLTFDGISLARLNCH